MKRTPEPHASREFTIEYYKQLIHKHPHRCGYSKDDQHALWCASRNLDDKRKGYVRAVIVHRPSGLVVATRLKVGKHIIQHAGDWKPRGRVHVSWPNP